MTKDIYINKLHTEIISIMDVIDEVCSKNNLKYFLIGGSLLGAVRHKGFIPWDDDLDIVMPRADYNKFIKIMQFTPPTNLYLRWITTEDNYWQMFAKVCKTNTLFEESDFVKCQHSGIFVDVFPIDLCDGYNKRTNIIRLLINQFKTSIYQSACETTFRWDSLLPYTLRKMLSVKRMHNIINSLILCNKGKNQDHYAMYGSTYSLRRQVFPIEWFGKGIYLQFEGRTYCCPKSPESVLKLTFGDDFMTPPPADKRITHMPRSVLFSDGEQYISSQM